MDSCFVQVDGVPIHYWRAGSGPPLVMVHGLIADGMNWQYNVPALAPLRTIYALDLLNMGRSARLADAPAGLAETADWLARLLDALGLASADFVGSSHGGAVCLMLAVRHPARVRSLMLFAPANPFCAQPRLLLRFWNSFAGRSLARVLPHLPRWVLNFAHRRVYGDPSKAPTALLESYRAGLNRHSIDHVLRITCSWWPDMAELQVGLPGVRSIPALLLWGKRDRVVSLGSGRVLQQVLGAELQIVAGGPLTLRRGPRRDQRRIAPLAAEKPVSPFTLL